MANYTVFDVSNSCGYGNDEAYRFDTKRDVLSWAENRRENWLRWGQSRESFNVLVYKDKDFEIRDCTDQYPDFVVEIGPRGAVKLAAC